MANALYDRAQATAQRLIDSYGGPVSLVRRTNTGTDFAPVYTEVVDTVQAVLTTEKYMESGGEVQSREIELLFGFDAAPTTLDLLRIDDVDYEIDDVETVNPGGVKLIYKVLAKR